MASGLEPALVADVESGAATAANNGEAPAAPAPAGRSRRGLRALLAAAAFGGAGLAAVQQASPASSAAGAAVTFARRQLSSSWDKEYSREPLIKVAKEAGAVNKEVQAKIRISFEAFPTEEQQAALKQALIAEMEVDEADVTEFHVSHHQDGAYNIVAPADPPPLLLAHERRLPVSKAAQAQAAAAKAARANDAGAAEAAGKVPCDIVIAVQQASPAAAELLKQRTDAKFIDAQHECAYLASHTGMPSYSCQWTVQRVNDDDWDDDWLSRLQKDGHDVTKLGGDA